MEGCWHTAEPVRGCSAAQSGDDHAWPCGQVVGETEPGPRECGRDQAGHRLGAAGIDLEPQLADLGTRWETPRIAYKPFPACHFIHGSLGATETLHEGLDPNEIEEVVVTIPEEGVSLVLEPAELKIAPRSDYEGKFSLQFSTAAMLVHGRVGVTTYTPEALSDTRVLELARKVRYETKEYASYPAAFPGGVRIVEVVATPVLEAKDHVETESVPLPGQLPTGRFLGAIPDGVLVAREQELNTLESLLATVLSGSGRLVVLAGEPGVGKTRLAQEITLRARDFGFQVATGRCYEPHQGVPYYPFLEALASVYRSAPSSVRQAAPQPRGRRPRRYGCRGPCLG